MDNNLSVFLKEPYAVNHIIEVLSFITAIIFFIISIIKHDELQISLKIGGACFVMLLALFANSAPVYALAIFIIATFITKLDFLENLAAIFWNRKEFWKYRTSLSKATSMDAEKKINNEIKREPILAKFGTPEAIRTKAAELEHAVVAALKKSQLFPDANIKTQLLLNVGNRKYVLDAVIQTLDIDYIIEVKISFSPQMRKTVVRQMEEYVKALSNYYATNGQLRGVRGIIVIHSSEDSDDFIGQFAILKFDMASEVFTNSEAIKKWISNEDM